MTAYFIGPKRVYALTEEDKLWLARCIAGETGDHPKNFDGPAAVAWSMMNRFLLVKGQEAWPTFTSLLRNYSQPINPKWARGGAKCPVASLSKDDLCSEDALQRRARITGLAWQNINIAIRNFVESFAEGNVTMPDAVLRLPYWRITDFAAFHRKEYTDREIGFDLNGIVTDKDARHTNWFFEIKGILDCEVHVVRADRFPLPQCFPVSKSVSGGWTTLNTLAVVMGLGVAGIIAYLAWARSQW
jgi:hypothetical protein